MPQPFTSKQMKIASVMLHPNCGLLYQFHHSVTNETTMH